MQSTDLSTLISMESVHALDLSFKQSVFLERRSCSSYCQVRAAALLRKTLASEFSSHQCYDFKAFFFVVIYDSLLIFTDEADMKDSNNRWIM